MISFEEFEKTVFPKIPSLFQTLKLEDEIKMENVYLLGMGILNGKIIKYRNILLSLGSKEKIILLYKITCYAMHVKDKELANSTNPSDLPARPALLFELINEIGELYIRETFGLKDKTSLLNDLLLKNGFEELAIENLFSLLF